MNKNYFKSLIDTIPADKWEEIFSIGTFEKTIIKEVLKRRYSIVARCEVVGNLSKQFIYIKYYKNVDNLIPSNFRDLINRDFHTLRHYYRKFNSPHYFGVVKPLFVFPEKFGIITQEVGGKKLSKLIEEKSAICSSKNKKLQLRALLQMTGAWLNYFQSLDTPTVTSYSIDELIEYITVRLDILIEDKRRQFPRKYYEQVLNFIENNRYSVTEDELELHASHNDFNLGNIIINGKCVTVLDFGKIKHDSFLLDVSRIYHQLLLLSFKPQYRLNVIRQLQRALLYGFGIECADRLMLFRFFLLRHTLTHLIGITCFWQQNLKERFYNYWVLYNELNYLGYLIST